MVWDRPPLLSYSPFLQLLAYLQVGSLGAAMQDASVLHLASTVYAAMLSIALHARPSSLQVYTPQTIGQSMGPCSSSGAIALSRILL